MKNNDLCQYTHQRNFFNREFNSLKHYVLEEWQKNYLRRIFCSFDIGTTSKNKFFLDIGVGGSGYTVIEFAKKGLISIGCDLSVEAIKKAKKFANEQKVAEKTGWVVCSAEHLPFKNQIFDFVVSNAVLEHLPDDRKAVSEISRITKNKCRVFITVPLSYKYVWLFLWPIHYIYDKRIGHLRRYDVDSLQKLFNTESLITENVFYTGHLLKVLGVISSKIMKTNKFDTFFERVDRKSEKKRYGASNICVAFSRKDDKEYEK